jgi:hypothetical protein
MRPNLAISPTRNEKSRGIHKFSWCFSENRCIMYLYHIMVTAQPALGRAYVLEIL